MIISYLGGEFFKMQFGDLTLAFNPASKDSRLKSARFGADIALVSLNDLDFNGVSELSFGDKKPFVITGPGEYETKDIFIRGFKSKSYYGVKGGAEGGSERINTIYTLVLDSMNICFLGALGSDEIDAETKEALGDIDILFLPIGGKGDTPDDVTLDAVKANKLAVALEPRLIIPMHYGDAGLGSKTALKTFLKESGEESITPVDKLTIKKKDLEGKQGDVAVLSVAR
jgi:L-ascorbate metabolism protein UlaG (beta-lactamase superfamily)